MATSAGIPAAHEVGAAGEKGLKTGALGFVSNIVIGVASTAPAYSLAVSLGLVALAVGIASPAIMWMAFVPMLFIAIAYYYMNRADPDCGTSFTWVSSGMGPHLGWLTGWGIIVADVIVMASLAEVAAQYTFALFGVDVYETPIWAVQIGDQAVDFGVIALGILFVAVLTWICYRGIELSARTQVVLLAIELVALAAFAVVALFRVYTDPPDGAMLPTLEWLNPLAIVDEDGAFSASALAAGLLIALFIYWGWDTTATVNEESADPTEQPGRATIIATVILVLTYVIVTIAAQAWAGVDRLQEAGESDVFAAMANEILGSPLDKIVILAVLTSAAASTQTTILPTARTALSMGAKRALPAYWAKVHPTLPDADQRDDLDGHPVGRVLRRAEGHLRERVLRRAGLARADDRLLLRPDRLRLRHLLPPRAVQERQEPAAHRPAAAARRAHPDLGVRPVDPSTWPTRSTRTPAPIPRT